MTEPAEGIVELYAEHLSRKASSTLVTLAVAGAVGGAVLGAVPGLLSHSIISPGVNYFAVFLGGVAGGFVGRSLGEKKAVGLRLQAQLALHQGQIARRLAPAASVVAAPVVAAPPQAPVPQAPAPQAPVPQLSLIHKSEPTRRRGI
jgi:hypothetical protein